ncbi:MULTISPECIES: D-alanyl-D-alanine carboxypeptidase family protein [Moraxella]|uniref:D-alanyl-D-alanine carboxypeptidase family protein n=1 Tax=Moraxella catarrhalis TaxID=480 RepID=A0ABY0BMY1_MORCA|nr:MULTISPECIES: serine hydrolase [Moraxella]AIT43421.1 D-alanyl-D-alanine endopeptidase precursor [Moraxella catarrhalis]ARB67798.1 peptidase S11 [Moraxella catarrhalis]AXT93375.1 peptidase S11 [Moraxella catarrhalis]EGE13942.1 D-alanyl-D-alanine endopeptidase [Moraxella catarrhalis 103P14B1]EGE16608.1 D-alanyl-D-alanine endopeptidase [Moraxella catarrhalis BC1]
MKFIKQNSHHLAMLLAMTTGAHQAHAFSVDNSQQRITVQPTYVQPAQVITSQSVYVEPTAQVTTTTNVSVQAVPQAPQEHVVSQEGYAQTQLNIQPQVISSTKTQTTAYTTTLNAQTAILNDQNSYTNSFYALPISTRSAAVLVYDLQDGKLIYGKNADVQRSIASISKVMTAMVILDAELDMREEITLIASDLIGAKQASTRLKAGDRMTRSEFTLMMLMRSENPAAKALARTYPGGYDAFIAAMNQKAYDLGMYQTKFSDSSGLDPRNMSSANDLLIMMKAVNSSPRYHSIRNFSTAPHYDFYIANYGSGDRIYKGNNTNRLVREGAYPIGVQKTGYIREAGYSVVMETNINNRPAIVVLLGASNSANRWSDAETILTELAYRQ